jgi:hypothetical protein
MSRKYTWGNQEAEEGSFDHFCQTYFVPHHNEELDRTFFFPKEPIIYIPFHDGTICAIDDYVWFKEMYLDDLYSRTEMAAKYTKKFLKTSKFWSPENHVGIRILQGFESSI